ncbi:MAG TPA: hypothetical protein VFS64_04530 [Solirubrobacterales bacterium]|nr:hypothetical protein [Solirubrobacterales bacterium]
MPGDAADLDQFAAYAAAHKLALEPEGRLPRTTPLLAEGELRSVEALMRGWLGEYLEAQIAIVRRAGADDQDAQDFTVAVTHVPKAKRFAPWLLCHRVEDEHLLGRAAEQLIHGNDRVDLESAELDRCYRIYASPDRDDVWLRELFSPGFIVFLLDLAPTGFAFEYVEGTLCVSQHGRLTLAEDIDRLRDATVELVARVRAEIRERLGEAQGRSGASGWEG